MLAFLTLFSSLSAKAQNEALEKEILDGICGCITDAYADNPDVDLELSMVITTCFEQVGTKNEKKFLKLMESYNVANPQEFGRELGFKLVKQCDYLKNIIEARGVTLLTDEEQMAEADKLFEEGEFEKAAESYWQVHLKDPGNARALNDMGVSYMALDRNDEALAAFIFAIKLLPGEAVYHANIGEAYYNLDRSDKAIEHFTKAIELDPEQWRARSFLGLLQASYLDEFETGIANLMKSTEAKPDDDEYWNNLGMAYYYEDKLDTAIHYFRIAYQKNEYSSGLYNIAYLYSSMEEYDSSAYYYSAIIKRDPENAEAWSDRASVYESLASWDLALSDYQKSLELDPSQEYLHYNIGNVYYQMGEYQKAIKEANVLEKLMDLSDAHYLLRGKAYYELKKYKDAIKNFEAGLEIAPDNAYFFDYIGKTQLELGNYQEAVDAFSSSIELYDSDGEIYYLRGKAKLEMADKDGACEDFSTGMEYNSLDAEDAHVAHCAGE